MTPAERKRRSRANRRAREEESRRTDEWCTPEKYIVMAREVMGNIDLDPASCEFAQRTVQADRFFTMHDDGLAQRWTGKVWLNPPYSGGRIVKFVGKLCEDYLDGHVTEAIVLVPNFTDTQWSNKLMRASRCVCFMRGRIRFYNKEGVGNSPLNGHMFFYFGQGCKRFDKVFRPIGLICA